MNELINRVYLERLIRRLQKVALFGTLRELKLYKEVETQTYVWFKNLYHYKIIKC